MLDNAKWSTWEKRENDRKVVILISLLFTGVVTILLLMTVWNPKVQAVMEEYRIEPVSTESYNADYCDKHICLDDLSNPVIYNLLRRR